MTIRQQGGIFGRNPTFNNVGVTGSLTGLSNLSISGNLIVANGQGIDFSATAGTGTSELFDDYEEGTWTPEYVSGLTGVTYTGQNGKYTKVGNTVFFFLSLTSSTATAGATQVQIGGLPFTALGGVNGGGSFAYSNGNFNSSTSTNNPLVLTGGNQTRLDFYVNTGGAFNGTNVSNAAANLNIQIFGQYLTS